jgi:hypothetical protein
VSDRAGARDGQDLRGHGQHPGQYDLVLGHAVPPGGGDHGRILVRLLHGRPRQEHQLFLLAQVDQRFGPAVGRVVPVLHRHDRDDLLRLAQLGL